MSLPLAPSLTAFWPMRLRPSGVLAPVFLANFQTLVSLLRADSLARASGDIAKANHRRRDQWLASRLSCPLHVLRQALELGLAVSSGQS